MRILYLVRADAGRMVSGVNEQVRQYAKAMEARGHHTIVHEGHVPPNGRFDLAHVFNVDWPLETSVQMDVARARADRVVLSPVHHDRAWEQAYHVAGREGLPHLVSRVGGVDTFMRLRGVAQAREARSLRREALEQLVAGVRRPQREVLRGAERWMVVAEREARSVSFDFGVEPQPWSVIRNGADWVDDDAPVPGLPDDFVLSVGRIEGRKNQIALGRALVELDVPGVFVGVPNPRHPAFVRDFAAMVTEQTCLTWLPAPTREQRLALFRRARMHVLASWYEVQSLVDSEAAVAGCPIVTTARGYTHENLGDAAVYWDPGSGHDGLVATIRQALGRERDPGLAQRARATLAWDVIAEELAAAYAL